MKSTAMKALTAAIVSASVASIAQAAPAWQQGTAYKAGDQVTSAQGTYECKPFPYEGWCGLSAYEPGVGFAWTDAWIAVDGSVIVTPTPVVTAAPTTQPTAAPTAAPTSAPVVGDYPEFVPGTTKATNGQVYSFGGACWEAKNSPGTWETPREGWFWTEVACGTAPTAEPTVAPTAEPTVAPTAEPTVAPTAEPTVAPTAEPTVAPTAEPTVAPTAVPTTAPTVPPVAGDVWCPTGDSFDAGVAYQPGDTVIYQGNKFEAGAWTRGNAPVKGVTQTDWENVWKDLGPIAADWCAGIAVDTSGRELDMTGWPHPLKRQWKDYDNASGKQVGAYFVEWGVYGRDFLLEDTPLASITHMYYAFLTIKGDNSTALNAGAANDGWADVEFEVNTYDEFPLAQKGFHPSDRYPSGDGLAPGEFAGLLAEMTRAKAAHPQLKIIPSVGGWTLSRPFYEMADSQAARTTFVNSVERFLRDYATTFDGIDLDWEFPGAGGNDPDKGCYVEGLAACQNADRARDYRNFTLLSKELREMLDKLSAEYGKPFELHAAVSPDPRRLEGIEWAEIGNYYDGINFMTYDYAGAWSNVVGHQTSLSFPQGPELEFTDGTTVKKNDWNAIGTISVAIDGGFPADKVSIGVGSYGRGWVGVPDDGNGARASFGKEVAQGPFSKEPNIAYAGPGIQAGNVAAWEDGIVDYAYARQEWMSGPTTGKNGWEYHYEPEYGAAWLYNPSNGQLVSFDSVESVKAKGDYVRQNGLGGLFMWEIDADNGELLNVMNESLGNNLE
ncbi:glycosyl hydrolase family 18 protein [Salinibius halmophilus]|uniref:glycosyl hydrolase family 18 protein n=1 Tax=Salinibius halmophilus TaxID=1853216 RepID=UPI000E65EF16|nr:glycosyl hydrolase family 18 protein [Salinibius halmophilus]